MNDSRSFLLCHPEPVEGGRSHRANMATACISIALITVFVMLSAFPASASEITHPKTFKGKDPKGWGQFHWQMTEAQAKQLGAKLFTDVDGEPCLGLSEVELLQGKQFQVCLKFFSHRWD